MKVPFTANTQNNSKSVNSTSTTTTTTTTTLYEPKSVLDLCRSPSPISEKPVSNTTTTTDILAVCEDPLQLEDHDVLINQHHLVDWDSLMRDLGLNDDSTPVSSKPNTSDTQISNSTQFSTIQDQLPPVTSFDPNQFASADFGLFPDISIYTNPSLNYSSSVGSFDSISDDLNTGNLNVGLDYVDELIRLAECFDTSSLQLGHVILARLNQRLSSPTGKPLHRAAFYFKEALRTILTGPPRLIKANTSEIIQTIKAQKTFSSISPIPMFSSFTANQALLEALEGSMHVHAIDLDIGLGDHWASFMKELADKTDPHRPALRISAVVREEYATESRLIRENLIQFARELNIRFTIEFVPLKTFEYLSFKAIKFMDGEKVAILSSPAAFRSVGASFLNDLRRVAPQVVVHVDAEGQVGMTTTTSYRQAVIDGLEFYSTLLESLEAASFNDGGDGIRRIEASVVFPRILEGMEAPCRRGMAGREALVAAGLRQVGVSQFAGFQAEFLLRRAQVRGFHVVRRQAEMLLCWHDRPLVSMSAWRY